jgi:hypothetical protein
MATRKKTARKKAARKKTSAGKKTAKKPARKATRKKATRKKATAKKATRKTAAAKKPARSSTRKTTGSKAAPRRKPSAPQEAPEVAIASRIVAAAVDPSSFDMEALYTPDCVSIEGNGARVEGYAGLREKTAGWQALLESSTWEARHVFTRPGAIAIEWDAQIKFKDGRSVRMSELAIHELRGGRIAAERYYYDPASIAPPEQPREPYTPSAIDPPAGDSGIDPMDL